MTVTNALIIVNLLTAFRTVTLGTFGAGNRVWCELRCYLPQWTPMDDLRWSYLSTTQQLELELPESTCWQLEYNRGGVCFACRLPVTAIETLLPHVNNVRKTKDLKPLRTAV